MSQDRKTQIKSIVDDLGIKDAEISMTNNGHYQIKSPSLKRLIYTGSTPSDSRGDLNLKGDLRREMIGEVKKKGVFTDQEKIEIIKEWQAAKNKGEFYEKYRLSNHSLSRWCKAFGVETKTKGYNNRGGGVSADIKNRALKAVLNGEKPTEVAERMGQEVKNIYNWRAQYKKNGFFVETPKNIVKKIANRNLENNKTVSYINSGKKSAPANENQDFKAAINLLSAMPDRITELEKLLIEKDKIIGDLNAKFEVIKEAASL